LITFLTFGLVFFSSLIGVASAVVSLFPRYLANSGAFFLFEIGLFLNYRYFAPRPDLSSYSLECCAGEAQNSEPWQLVASTALRFRRHPILFGAHLFVLNALDQAIRDLRLISLAKGQPVAASSFCNLFIHHYVVHYLTHGQGVRRPATYRYRIRESGGSTEAARGDCLFLSDEYSFLPK
jgi:hypothetical protein